MYTTIFAASTQGIDAHLVLVEVDLSYGMLQFNIVGLPDTAIKESKQRIVTALKNSGIRLPERKITVNLAPADLKKEGTMFDLAIAVGILQASNHIQMTPNFMQETLFLGELSLDGSVRPVRGVLPVACDAVKLSKKRLIISCENAHEAALIEDVEVIGVRSIAELIGFLRGEVLLEACNAQTMSKTKQSISTKKLDFNQVKGQWQAKRALLLVAAGRHNILLMGSPGSGKTMLAERLSTIMPPMSFQETIATSKIYSICGKLIGKTLVAERPFRSPHHSISQAGLIGGGSIPQPGEISLTHNGILFLDELTEFKRSSLEALRQPLEHKTVSIARANQAVTYPASFLFVAALNPCPCGFLGDKQRTCVCSEKLVGSYLQKLSGPLLDRIDVQIHVQSLAYEELKKETAVEEMSSDQMAALVQKACAMQLKRFGSATMWNGLMSAADIEKYCILTPNAEQLVKKAFSVLNLSMRGYHKLLKIARTIADLEENETIQETHIKEAIFYRSLDQTLSKMRS